MLRLYSVGADLAKSFIHDDDVDYTRPVSL